MKLYDEQISLRRGSDTGEDNAASVQPIARGETVWNEIDNRPIDNLRARTEILRRALESHNFFADYDRSLLLRADAPFSFTEPVSGTFAITLTASGNLWVYPALSPGRQSGGRWHGGRVFCTNTSAAGAWTPYVGTPAVDDLILTADRRYTGQRGYDDSDSFTITAGGRSVGANRIEVALAANSGVAGGVAGIVATITGSPRVKISITYGTSGTPTTLAELITFINGDRTSQGAYGVADFLRASSTGTTTNPPVPFTDGLVQGAYDSEAHQITKGQFDAFFDATDGGGAYINRLREGEGLAVGYSLGPVERGTVAPKGGRRQAVWDLPTDRTGTFSQNTTPVAGWALFVTGREPEKIPGAIPLGKVINGEFIFIDGTRLAPGETLELGASRTTYSALAATTNGADGASLIGYEGGAPWSADATPPSGATLPADDLSDTITRVATDITTTTTGEAGSRRVGGEAQTGSAGLGSSYFLSLTAGSLREQLVQLLQGVDGGSRTVGLNGRVSQHGHAMLGADPLKKEFGAAGQPASGGEFLRTQLHAPTNLLATSTGSVREKAFLTLCPIIFNVSGTDNMVATETGTVASATAITMTSMSSRFTSTWGHIPLVLDLLAGASVPMVYAYIYGTSGAADAPEGLYVVHAVSTGASTVTFKKLNGADPNFTGAAGTISVSFFQAFEVGADHRATRLRWTHIGADAAFFDAAGNPAGVLGVSSNDAPLIKVFTPDTSTNAGVLQAVWWANRMEWRAGAGPSDNSVRSTANILFTPDKNLLDGQEDHLTVDATLSHHHGGNYTETRFYASTGLVVQDNNTDVAGYTLNAIAGRQCDTRPANTARRGVILDVTLKIKAAAGVIAGAVVTLRIGFWSNAAGTGSPHANVEVSVQMQAAPGVTTLHSSHVQITVPTEAVSANDFFYFAVTNRTLSTFDGSAGAQLVSITEVGGIFVPIDTHPPHDVV